MINDFSQKKAGVIHGGWALLATGALLVAAPDAGADAFTPQWSLSLIHI